MRAMGFVIGLKRMANLVTLFGLEFFCPGQSSMEVDDLELAPSGFLKERAEAKLKEK